MSFFGAGAKFSKVIFYKQYSRNQLFFLRFFRMGDCDTSSKVTKRNEWNCFAHMKIWGECQNSSLLAASGHTAASQWCWDSAERFGPGLPALCLVHIIAYSFLTFQNTKANIFHIWMAKSSWVNEIRSEKDTKWFHRPCQLCFLCRGFSQ